MHLKSTIRMTFAMLVLVCVVNAHFSANAYAQQTNREALDQAAEQAFQKGNYAECERLASEAVRSAQQQNIEDGVFSTSYSWLGGAFSSQSKLESAQAAYLKDLALSEKLYGDDSTSVAAALNNLGVVYSSQGKYSEAEPLYKRSLAIREHRLGADHPDIANSLNNLSELSISQWKIFRGGIIYRSFLEY